MDSKTDPQILAQEVGQALTQVDENLLALLGIELLAIGVGHAAMQMRVGAAMVNSHGYCQGGLLFALADQALAYACMSGNKAGVTLSATAIFNLPAQLGDLIHADARVTTEGGRTASGRVELRNQAGEIIAQLQGVNYRLNRPVLPPADTNRPKAAASD